MESDEFFPIGPWSHFGNQVVSGLLMQDIYGRLLLQFRDDLPNVVHGGKWSLFGGAVEDGETLRSATVRETREELGIEISEIELTPFAKTVSDSAERKQIYTFTCGHQFSVRDIRLGEGAGFAVFTREQLGKLDLAPPIVPVIERYKVLFMDNDLPTDTKR